MKTDLFQSCGHCWVFQICWHIECSTFTPSSIFIAGDWNEKGGSQEIPAVTGKFGLGVQNEEGQRLTEFCQENTLVIANTLFQQHEMTLYMDIKNNTEIRLITFILCRARWSSIQSAKTRSGADRGSDHQLLIAKLRLDLKKAGKTTKAVRYELNPLWILSRGDR